MPAIVADPDEVTADWLTEVLAHAGVQATVSTFTLEHVGTGQVGDNVRYRLQFSAGEGPGSIIIKFASQDPVSRETGKARRNYTKEVNFYRDLYPTVGIRTPRLLFADLAMPSQDFCIVMEDLHPAVQGNQITGCSVA